MRLTHDYFTKIICIYFMCQTENFQDVAEKTKIGAYSSSTGT